jgi:hypothetical protein
MFQSIDLFERLLSRFATFIQQRKTFLTLPQSCPFKANLFQQDDGILCFTAHVKPVKKV